MKNLMGKFKSFGKKWVIGATLNPLDSRVFHHVSLVAFFALVGLGSDGLSSSVYGPAEAFSVLHHYPYLAILVGLASVFTIFVISKSYSQIIERFPNGGGGYVVASKLLSPTIGMVSGCALLVDYILTITISIASGADAIFSFLPAHYHYLKLHVAVLGILLLLVLNLRGAKETVKPLIPIFLLFMVTHIVVIGLSISGHFGQFTSVISQTHAQINLASMELGLGGLLFLLLKAYSMGAGTYTGIEAISNGVGILREPKVKTAKKTMTYMSISLSVMVMGFILAYIFFKLSPSPTKTFNALLLESLTLSWPTPLGHIFAFVTLFSEAAILFVAAQTGFFDGPRVLANMALDRWFPSRFAMLSDRLVTQKGILMMGISAIVTMIFTRGKVEFLIVLYSINVFITFFLSQLGMSKLWIFKRSLASASWKSKLLISGFATLLTGSILVSMVLLKFDHGGWVTLFITGSLIVLMVFIKRHYIQTAHRLRKLDRILQDVGTPRFVPHLPIPSSGNPNARTAVLLVNGFTGLGLSTLSSIINSFPRVFENFIFIQVGLIDAGVFKGQEELGRLQKKVQHEVEKYVDIMRKSGYFAESISRVGLDIIQEIEQLSQEILSTYPHATFFGGQLVFPEETIFTKWLHNSVVFSIQQRLFVKGVPFVILPVQV